MVSRNGVRADQAALRVPQAAQVAGRRGGPQRSAAWDEQRIRHLHVEAFLGATIAPARRDKLVLALGLNAAVIFLLVSRSCAPIFSSARFLPQGVNPSVSELASVCRGTNAVTWETGLWPSELRHVRSRIESVMEWALWMEPRPNILLLPQSLGLPGENGPLTNHAACFVQDSVGVGESLVRQGFGAADAAQVLADATELNAACRAYLRVPAACGGGVTLLAGKPDSVDHSFPDRAALGHRFARSDSTSGTVLGRPGHPPGLG